MLLMPAPASRVVRVNVVNAGSRPVGGRRRDGLRVNVVIPAMCEEEGLMLLMLIMPAQGHGWEGCAQC